jgi:hypothetical protein
LTGLLAWWIGDPERLNHVSVDVYRPLLVSISDSAFTDDSIEEERTRPVPFRDETIADDFVLAVVGEPFSRNETDFIRMQLLAVYKGQLPMGRFNVGQNSHHRFECSLSEQSTGLLTAGNRLALYLEEDPNRGWTVTTIRDLTESEHSWRASVGCFCDVLLACESNDSAARYRELLAANEKKPLDAPAYYALMSKPCPHAVEAVRPFWDRAIASLSAAEQTAGGLPRDVHGGGGGFRQHDSRENTDSGEAISDQDPGGQQASRPPHKEAPPALPSTVDAGHPPELALAQLLARLHDDRSIDTVLQHGKKQPLGLRADYFELLPDLCQNADARTIQETRDSLKLVLLEADVEAETPIRDHSKVEDDAAAQNEADLSEEFSRIRMIIQRLQQRLEPKRDDD